MIEYDIRKKVLIICEKCFDTVETTQEIFEHGRRKYGSFLCEKCEAGSQ